MRHMLERFLSVIILLILYINYNFLILQGYLIPNYQMRS